MTGSRRAVTLAGRVGRLPDRRIPQMPSGFGMPATRRRDRNEKPWSVPCYFECRQTGQEAEEASGGGRTGDGIRRAEKET